MIIATACVTLVVWFVTYKALESRGRFPLFAMLTLPVLVALGAMPLMDRMLSGRSWTAYRQSPSATPSWRRVCAAKRASSTSGLTLPSFASSDSWDST